MSKTRLAALRCLPFLVWWLSPPAHAQDTLLFDNSQADLNYRFSPGGFEVGDQIRLCSPGFLREFAFEFYGTNSLSPDNTAFAGTVEARVRFYWNDGPAFNGVTAPGTLFFDSDWVALERPTPRNTLVFEAGRDFPDTGLFLSQPELTWSVQFRGAGPTDTVGIDIYSPPTVGQSWPDYWRFLPDSGWRLENNVVPMDFAARLRGTIPEPSTLAILSLGASGLLLATRRRSSLIPPAQKLPNR